MKKIMIFAAVAAMFCLVSCQKEEIMQEEGKPVVESKESPVFTAFISGATKTTVDASNGKVAWEAIDEITVTDASSAKAIYKIESIDTETGKATFVIKENESPLGAGPYSATYGTEPAESQTYSATAGRLYMTAPETSDNSFTFTVQCGLLKLNLTQAGIDIAKVEITGTPTDGEQTTYTLTCETPVNISSAKDFFIALPAGDYTKFVMYDCDESTCTKTVKSTPLSIGVNRIRPVTFSSLVFEYKTLKFSLYDEHIDDSSRGEISTDIWGIQW